MNDKWERIGELSHGDVHYRNAARDLDAVVPEGVEQSIREPLESRLEALEEAVLAYFSAKAAWHDVDDSDDEDGRASAAARFLEADTALRALTPSTEAPSEEK